MDREISLKEIRKNKLKKIILVGGVFVCIVLSIMVFQSILKPNINKSQIRTCIVDKGKIEATISARGVIVPEFESVITSSIASKIIDVYHRSGDIVKKGDSILLLDKEEIMNTRKKMLEDKQLKNNDSRNKQLEFKRALNDLKISKSIKELSIKNLESYMNEARILEDLGGGTMEEVEQAEFKLKVAQIEMKQLDKKIEQQQTRIEIEVESRRIEEGFQDRKLKVLEKQIEQADVKAEYDGVITWVNEEFGKTVGRKETIARMADLSTYIVNCSISDIHSEKIHLGCNVIIDVNSEKILGTISQISASSSNGEVSFSVKLADEKSKFLRPNLAVNVYVITSCKEDVVRVRNGGFYNGSKKLSVFKIEGGEAIKVKLETGVNNYEFVEIVSGLSPGDELIISDMTDKLRHEKLTLIEQQEK